MVLIGKGKSLPGFVLCVALSLLPYSTGECAVRLKASSRSFTANQGTVWERYKVADGEFSVLLPTVPSMSSYHGRMESLARSPLRHLVGAYAQGVVYAIYVFERKQSLEDLISDFHHSSATDLKRELSINGVRGKEFAFRNDERMGLTDFFVTARGIYVFDAQGSFLGNPDEGIPKFLQSISFFGNKDAQALVDGPGTPWTPQPPNTPETSAADTFSGKVVTRKAVVITKPEPTYTEEARQQQVTGTVVIRCVFRSSGVVSNITVMSGLEHGLTEKATAAGRQIKFIPAIKDGRFVSMWMELQYNFNLY
jgi:TonB family protein